MMLLISIVYGIGGTLLISLSFHGSLKLEQEQALQTYKSLRSMLILVNSLSEQTTEQDVADALTQLSDQNPDWRALRLYTSETVLFESDRDFEFDPIISEKFTENICAMKIIRTQEGHSEQITGSLYAGDKLLFLDAARDISDLYTLRETQLKIFRVLFAAVVTLSAVVSFLTAHFLTKPLHHLSVTSRKIADGDLSLRSDVHSGDEIERLSDDFNIMAESLTNKIQALENAMERQERFMGSFAHELKTPMTSMIGYADLMRSCELSENQQRECSEYIFKEGRRLERLSLKLLDLLVLKKQDFTLVEASPAKLLCDAALSIDKKLRSCGVALQVRTQEGKCLLEPDLIKSLLLNLIDNAVKAFDCGGKISVSQCMLGDGCGFIIKDNGRGIPKEELENITEAFYRVDKSRSRKQGGAGLGLALCSEIVRLHNGRMCFFSEVGKGTEIVVELRGGLK